jgi:hypothetical protein
VHVVLLGDSVFDNAAYVSGGPDVVTQLRARLAPAGRATLLALDGAVVRNVPHQIEGLPADATHLVVSAGGNDALGAMGVLQQAVGSVSEAVLRLAELIGGFQRDYHAMLDAVSRRRLPTAVCTIYYPRYPDRSMQLVAFAGLALFNDCILREAFARGLPVIDLRFGTNHDADFANPIEPSVIGGDKIAAAIARLLAAHDFQLRQTAVFVR